MSYIKMIRQKEKFMKVGIVGRPKATHSYESFLFNMHIPCITSLTLGELADCQALIFPGGGDINPQFFNAPNLGSENIDTELDLLQLRAFELAYAADIPILGICKGMQLINIALGGTLIQHLSNPQNHTSINADVYHDTITAPHSFLQKLYGSSFQVNSRHHQAIRQPGQNLLPIQWCPDDLCLEAFIHNTRPIIGVQWHPERLDSSRTTITGLPLFQYFLSFA